MVTQVGNPQEVRVGPGRLLIAPLLSVEPVDLATPWDDAWVPIGYTDAGSVFNFNAGYEDVLVAEELDPINTFQTSRSIAINFAAAQLSATNMQRAFNGGTILTPTGLVTFEPPAAGVYTPVMLGWESSESPTPFERWIFRKCIQAGNVAISRAKAPAKAQLPMSFRGLKPDNDAHGDPVAAFKFIHDANYAAGS